MTHISFSMLQTTQGWNWFDVFKAVIGPIMAAIFVVIGIWLKERYDRRKAVQSWYEQYYITEGLDILISYISALKSELVNSMFALVTHPTCPDRLPVQVAARVQTLLKNSAFSTAYDMALKFMQDILDEMKSSGSHELSKLNALKVNTLLSIISNLGDDLQTLRKELLQIQVNQKTEIYEIANQKRIATSINACNEELMKRMVKLQKIYELEAAGLEPHAELEQT